MLCYTLDQGKTEHVILEQSYRFNIPLPEALQNAPILWPGNELYYNAFLELNTERPLGWSSMGPIPHSKIREYCYLEQLDQEQTERMLWLIPKLDRKFLDKGKKKDESGAIQQTNG